MTALNTNYVQTAADLLKVFRSWQPLEQDQAILKEEYEHFLVERGAAALDRNAGSQHMTASAFIFTPDLLHILLCFHRKAQFWVQLGGHIDPDDESAAAAAHREAMEESGLQDVKPLTQQPLDLNRHALAHAFGSCKIHWHIGYGFIARHDEAIQMSDESEDVAWWAVDQLPHQTPNDFADRINLVRAELQAIR